MTTLKNRFGGTLGVAAATSVLVMALAVARVGAQQNTGIGSDPEHTLQLSWDRCP